MACLLQGSNSLLCFSMLLTAASARNGTALRGYQAAYTCPDKCDGVNKCFFDPTCSTSGGVGCNAGGKGQDCRFCGTGGGTPACPATVCPELCDGVNKCFFDPTCSTSGGVGCNAGGKGQDCRFCDTGGGAPTCPAALLQSPTTCPELCDGVNKCFVDPTCSTSPGVGCNAGGKGQDCRFCDTGGGAPTCPAATTTTTTTTPSAVCPDKCDGVNKCFFDPTCSTSGGVGCNAGGKGQDCRFCDTGGGAPACPIP